MKVGLQSVKSWTGNTGLALMFEGDPSPLGIDRDVGQELIRVAAGERFSAKVKQTALLRWLKGQDRLILSGLGRRREFEPDKVRVAVAKGLKRAEEIGADSVGLLLPSEKQLGRSPAGFVQAAVEGAMLFAYRFDKYRKPKDDEPKPVEELVLVLPEAKAATASFKKAVEDAGRRAAAVCFTRDLVNEPPSPKAPEKLAARAQELARPGRIVVKVMRKPELEKLGMGGILGVGAGSHQPPCLIHLTYTPKVKAKKSVVVIGKGITFDSGGLSLKPAASMELMKDDMSGAAAVIGLFHYLTQSDMPVCVHGLVPLAENLPGGGAQKPGDVIRHYGGKTVEVWNTDAEGRLILADALAYGSTLKPDLMIDVATLTGACVVALGDEYSALLGTDQRTIERIMAVGKEQGEFFWQLPLVERYRLHLKSHVADLKNIGKPQNAGTIVAGLFLQEFVDKAVPWVHVDIAGAAFSREGLDYSRPGATGTPVRTLIALLAGL
ncbi:MAG: leucyl aminopeptidase [candidate division WOR-3 bacterium]